MAQNKTLFKGGQAAEEWAYFAGIVDERGMFTLRIPDKNKVQTVLSLRIETVHEELIKWIERFLGLNIEDRSPSRYNPLNPNSKPYYRFSASGAFLEFICQKIMPYLVVKKKQCDLILKFRETMVPLSNKKLPDDVLKKRLFLESLMNKLKRDTNRKVQNRFAGVLNVE